MPTDTSQPSSIWVKAGAWLVMLLVSVAVAEIAARIIFPLPEVRNFDRAAYSPQMVSGPLLRQVSLAHASFKVESAPDGAASLHELNLNGFRDSEWSVAKKHARRLFFVGDSMVEGFLAARDETIPKVFERIARAEGSDVEAWNLGVGGAGLREYVQMIQDAVPAYAPEELILVLHANDLLGSPTFGRELVKPSFVAQRGRPWIPRLASVIARVMRGQTVARVWHEKPFSFFAAVPDPANPWTQNGATYERVVDPEIAAAMRQGRFNPFNVDEVHGYARFLTRPVDIGPWFGFLKEFLDARGVKFFLVYIPQANQTSDYYLKYKQRFGSPGMPSLTDARYQVGAAAAATAAGSLNIPFLDLTPAVRDAEGRGQHLYWNYDEHLRPSGYAFVANAIYEWRARLDLQRR